VCLPIVPVASTEAAFCLLPRSNGVTDAALDAAREGEWPILDAFETRADLDAFEAVVYDLDGTLVSLAVDWEAAARDAATALREAGVDVDGTDLWSMLDVADGSGTRDVVEGVLTDHECDGARASRRLELAEDAVARGPPKGVCSLNCEAACRLALDVHDLAGDVDAVVGRDTVTTRKPDPEPLLETLRRLGADPSGAVFVGDSRRDALTAERAGVAFRYVPGGPSGH